MLRRLFSVYSSRSRAQRGRLFRQALEPGPDDRILDLGSGDGAHIAGILPHRDNVWIADLSTENLTAGRRRFGFGAVRIDGAGRLPFRDGAFDIVFCSSVIEHVTVPKHEVGRYRTNREFARAAWTAQRRFAAEIRRIGRRYFVQTPNRWFPVESHTWLPAPILLLPRRLRLRLIDGLDRWWPKQTTGDWHLLTRRSMRELFPDAEIRVERSFGLAKSIIALKR